jgi:arylsulfatase
VDERPNIILFTTDQHRGDHLSIAGHPVVETPYVDSFANQGAYFPNAYSEIPSTTGARRILHSGRGNYDCGVIGYSGKPWDPPTTLAQELANAGYHCINVGWRNMHPRRKLFGFHNVICHDLHEGEDDYWDWLKEKLGPDVHERAHGCDANGWVARPFHLDEYYHPTNWTNRVSLEQIKRRDPTRPFFIWISHLRPHQPYDPPQCFWDMYIDRELPEVAVGDWAARYDVPNPGLEVTAWFGRLKPEQLHRARAGYMGSVTHLDYQLGHLMQRLGRELGSLNNTLFLFTSDHGDMQGDHHMHRKCYAYEGSARIPFVVRYPRGMDLPTGTFEHVVGLQDVMPTLLEAAGVPVPDNVTGRSVLRAIRGEPWRDVFHGEHSPCYAMEQAMQYLTDGTWKYIYLPYTGEEQLFDLTSDRQELHDLAKDPACAKRVAAWRQRLTDILASRGDGFTDGHKLLVRKERWGPDVEPGDPS